jgi:MFS family permease
MFFDPADNSATYACLFWGMFMFALGNGLCEAAINPLTATLYPKEKTHYLNILHAGWPGGLVLGALLALFFVGENAKIVQLSWQINMSWFLIPVAWYGFVTIKEKFPVSEAVAAGVGVGDMLKEFAAPMLLFLFLIHAMIGYVELGTDGWIVNILNNAVGEYALLLFIYTSMLMFVLRFFAGPIVHHINPLGLLFVSAIFATIGLTMLGSFESLMLLLIAGTIYGIGKTFFWPTMLGVVGERFPRGGAMTMGTIGGIGMLSAGLLGGPGIGFTQDYNAAHYLQTESAEAYEAVKSDSEGKFLVWSATGLDGAKVAELAEDSPYKGAVDKAGLEGGKAALRITAYIPATMAVCYLILIVYFRSKGGYKVVHLETNGTPVEGDEEPTAQDAIDKGAEGPDEY